MEQIEFDYPAKRKISRRAHVGVVGSGELEVLLEPGEGERSHVFIRTSVNGFRETWKAVLDRFFASMTELFAFRSTMQAELLAA